MTLPSGMTRREALTWGAKLATIGVLIPSAKGASSSALLSSAHRRNWFPSGLPGLKLWLKSSNITGLVDNDPISTWSDLSGNGKDATGSGAARPLYKTNVINGKPVVRFDGIDDVLSGAQVFSATPVHIFAVANMRVQDVVTQNIGVLFQQFSAALDYIAPYRSANVGGKLVSYNGLNLDSPPASPTTINTWNMWESLFNGANSISGINGSNTTGDSGALTPAGPYLLAKWGSGSQFLSWDIAEIVACNQVISAANSQLLRDYFETNYGIPLP